MAGLHIENFNLVAKDDHIFEHFSFSDGKAFDVDAENSDSLQDIEPVYRGLIEEHNLSHASARAERIRAEKSKFRQEKIKKGDLKVLSDNHDTQSVIDLIVLLGKLIFIKGIVLLLIFLVVLFWAKNPKAIILIVIAALHLFAGLRFKELASSPTEIALLLILVMLSTIISCGILGLIILILSIVVMSRLNFFRVWYNGEE